MPQPRAIVPDQGGIRPGLNNTGVPIAKHRIVKKTTTVVDGVTPAIDGAALPYGVTMQVIVDGYSGDVQIKGRAIVEASSAITIGQKITGAAGGKGAVASGGNFIVGEAASDATADGALFEVDLNPIALPA
jgi:Uncharacterized conserved protein (DUF2190)